MALKANNWINSGLKPLSSEQWLYWGIKYLEVLYEDIKQDWTLTPNEERTKKEEGVRYKYRKLQEAIQEQIAWMPPLGKDTGKLKSFLREWSETLNEEIELRLTIDYGVKEEREKLIDVFVRTDRIIGGMTRIIQRVANFDL